MLLVDPDAERRSASSMAFRGGRRDDHAALADAAEVDVGVERNGLQVLDLDAGDLQAVGSR